MVKILQYHAKKNWKQFQAAFFQFDLVGEFTPFQKKKFQCKNSHRSKQTTAKGKQIEN